LFEEMRRVGDDVLRLWREHHALSPPPGEFARKALRKLTDEAKHLLEELPEGYTRLDDNEEPNKVKTSERETRP